MNRRTCTTTLGTVLGGVLVGACLLVTVPAEAAAPPTCHGRPATLVGTSGDDVLVGTDQVDVVVGLGGADVIDGDDKADVVCGGPGRDVLRGGRGSDGLHGGPGRDLLVGGIDRLVYDEPIYFVGDLLDGGAGDDRLFGDLRTETDDREFSGPDTASYEGADAAVRGDVTDAAEQAGTPVRTGISTDVLHRVREVVGSRFADRLTSGAGYHDPRLVGGPGADSLTGYWLEGGPGENRLTVRGAGVAFGGPDDDVITLLGRDSVAQGGAGDDRVDAEGAGVKVFGDAGDDRLVVSGSGSNEVDPGDGLDVVLGGDGQEIVYTDGPDARVATGAGADRVYLDTLPGSLDLGGGRDQLDLSAVGYYGRFDDPVGPYLLTADLGSGSVTYRGRTVSTGGVEDYTGSLSQPNDVTGSGRADVITGGCRDDTVNSGAGADQVLPLTGDDVVDAGEGDDVVSDRDPLGSCYESEDVDDDQVDGGSGTDQLVFDTLSPGLDHVLDLAAGTASLRGLDTIAGVEDVTGSYRNETLRGDDGPNVLLGGGGNGDVLEGRGGGDTLTALRRGTTSADGGDGTDTCRAVTVVACENAPSEQP